MIQQTEWEGVVQVILRSCVYLVEKKADFTFIWAFSAYVPLEQLAVPAHLPPVCFKYGQADGNFCENLSQFTMCTGAC